MRNLKFKRYNVGDSFNPLNAERNTIHFIPVSTNPLVVKAYDVDEYGNIAEIKNDSWDENKELILKEVNFPYINKQESTGIIKRIDNHTKEVVTFKETNKWLDGNDITDDKVDNVIFIKENDKYYIRQISNHVNPAWWGDFTEKGINSAIEVAHFLNFEVSIFDEYLIDCSSNTSGVLPKNNTILNFKGGLFRAKTSTSDNYRMISVYNVKNVKIYNANIIGERNSHIGTGGEWGHGISITNSENVLLENPTIKDCWGDGIYIGNNYNDTSQISTDTVIINNAIIDNVRRNGISVTSNKNVTINNAKITNINGTQPQAGIDIEPEGSNGMPIVCDNINIKNLYTSNCKGGGLLLFLTHDVTLSNNPKMDINIENHTDENSQMGFFAAGAKDGLAGTVNLINSSYINNTSGAIRISNWGKEGSLKLNIENAKLKGWNTSLNTFYFYKNAINIIKESEEEYRNVGIVIKNPKFDFTGADISTFPILVSSANPNKVSILIDGIDDMKVDGVKTIIITKGTLLKDYKGILRGNFWETTPEINFIRPNGLLSVNSNKNTVGDNTFRIAESGWTDGQRFTILIERAAWTNILFDGNNLYDSEYRSSTKLSSAQIGSKITLEYNSGNFFVVEKNGLWSETDRIPQLFRVGKTEPENPFYPMIWFDLSTNKLKRRNDNNLGWDIIG